MTFAFWAHSTWWLYADWITMRGQFLAEGSLIWTLFVWETEMELATGYSLNCYIVQLPYYCWPFIHLVLFDIIPMTKGLNNALNDTVSRWLFMPLTSVLHGRWSIKKKEIQWRLSESCETLWGSDGKHDRFTEVENKVDLNSKVLAKMECRWQQDEREG